MGIRSLFTPKGTIVAALRRMWLRSRERAKALKDAGYCCAKCGVKQSKAKGKEVAVHVHHKSGIVNWDKMVSEIREHLLNPDDLEVLCKECHKKEHQV